MTRQEATIRWLRRFWLPTLVIATIITILVFPIACQEARWVGHTNLEVAFVIVDADNGLRIPKAKIRFVAEGGGFCLEDRDRKEDTMTTNSEGKLVRKWTECMCAGSKGPWRDTFWTYLPSVRFEASAPGYSTGGSIELNTPVYLRAVKRGANLATLEVKIALHKSPAKTSNDAQYE